MIWRSKKKLKRLKPSVTKKPLKQPLQSCQQLQPLFQFRLQLLLRQRKRRLHLYWAEHRLRFQVSNATPAPAKVVMGEIGRHEPLPDRPITATPGAPTPAPDPNAIAL